MRKTFLCEFLKERGALRRDGCHGKNHVNLRQQFGQPAQNRLLVRIVAKAHKLNVVPARSMAGAARQRFSVAVKDVLHDGEVGGTDADL